MRHDFGGASAEAPAVVKVEWRSEIAEDEEIAEMLPGLLREYRERAERLVSFTNANIEMITVPNAAPPGAPASKPVP